VSDQSHHTRTQYGAVGAETWPGVLAINLPLVLSILLAIAGGVIQGKAEDTLIANHPERYAPRFATVAKHAVLRWRAQPRSRSVKGARTANNRVRKSLVEECASGGGGAAERRLGLLAILRDELAAFDARDDDAVKPETSRRLVAELTGLKPVVSGSSHAQLPSSASASNPSRGSEYLDSEISAPINLTAVRHAMRSGRVDSRDLSGKSRSGSDPVAPAANRNGSQPTQPVDSQGQEALTDSAASAASKQAAGGSGGASGGAEARTSRSSRNSSRGSRFSGSRISLRRSEAHSMERRSSGESLGECSGYL